jgi:hypothetical protein
MNISGSLSNAMAELGAPTAPAADTAGRGEPPQLSASSAPSSALMKVADNAVTEDTGGVDAWA